jgi:radical SAM superfamily enzyme YgiQ (UPF0313 family)
VRIALVKPFEVSDSIQPNLGLGYLAAALTPGNDVVIVDCILEGLGPESLAARLAPFVPQIVGFQVNTFTVGRTRDYLRAVRQAFPEALTIAGGPHPTVLPQETFTALGPDLDLALQGEAEIPFARLAALMASGPLEPDAMESIPGLVWRDGGGGIRCNATVRTDLATIPMPRWDLMPPGLYPQAPHSAFFRAWPVAPLIASRGCPYACTFCSGSLIHGRTVRYRPVDSVLDEIRLLHDRYGVRELHFVDDNLTFDPEYVHRLCDGLLALPFRLPWACPNGVRLDSLDRELLDHMRKAGCYAVGLGIESGSPRILKRIRKGGNPELVPEQVARISEAGIETRGFFVLGFPTETLDEMEATVRLALELPLDFAHFMFYHPIPGTESYREIVAAQGDAEGVRWNASTFAEVAYTPDGIKPRTLHRIRRHALMRFYLRPRNLARLARQVRSTRHALFLARRVARWLK